MINIQLFSFLSCLFHYHVRTGVERANSEMKDNYGANHVRVRGHLKVLCHLMFGVLVLTVKQIFNYFAWVLTIAVDKTKPIAIGKEVYAMKHDFSWLFQEKITVDASKLVWRWKKQLFNKKSQNVLKLALPYGRK